MTTSSGGSTNPSPTGTTSSGASGGAQPGGAGAVGVGGQLGAAGNQQATGGSLPISATGGTIGAGGASSGGAGAMTASGGAGGSGEGNGGTSGAGGGAAGAAGSTAACVKGQVKGNEVVIIGDSYVQIPGTLEGDIEAHARMEGALMSGETYRNYAVSGTSMGNGQIPSQYTMTAKAVSKDIKVVIMDGGGNDVLILNPACLSAKPAANNASCVMTVDNAIMAGKTLFQQMAADGVTDVVYFFYPAVPAVTGDILEYSQPKVVDMCNSLTMPRCHFVSTREAFDGKTAQYIGIDGIHPTTAGAQVIADLVWDTMQKNCIAQ